MRTASVKYTDQARLRTDARVLDSLSRVGPRSAVNERARTVLVVRSDLLPYSETFVKQQVLACSRWKPVLVGLRRVAGVPVDELDVRMLPVAKSLAGRAYRKLLAKLQVTPGGVRRLLGSDPVELIHVHFGTDAVENWGWISSLRVPVIVTLHGYDINIDKHWWQSPAKPRAQRRYPAMLMEVAANPRVHFVAVSKAIRARAIEWGLPAERISLRHIGVNLRSFQHSGPPIAQRAPRILFVGRLVEKKGGEYLIRAFANVRAQVPAAELVMVGDGRLRGRLEVLAAELNVPVIFAGVLSNEQIRQELCATRVFCSPSITADNGDAEGLPIVILEAQACGIPVVTSARGGAQEGIVHGLTGYAFEEKDVNRLTAYLLRLLREDTLAASMSQAAYRNVESHFELTSCTAELEDLYDSWSAGISTRAGEAA